MSVIARLSLTAVACLLLARVGVSQEASGKWDFAVWVAGATGEELTNSFSEAQVWSAGIFVGRVLTPEVGAKRWRGRLEYGLDVIPFFAQSKPDVVYGGGFEPMILRWNLSRSVHGVMPYVELAGGGLRTTSNLPSGNTSSFNFSVKGGAGIYIGVRGRQFLDVGGRWSHISNANLGAQNPEFNGIELRVGYHWHR